MKLVKRIGLVLLTLLLLAPIIGYFGMRYEVKLHSGTFTEVLDPSTFVDSYKTIGIKNVNVLSSDSSYFQLRNIVLSDGEIQSVDSVSIIDPGIEYMDGRNQFLIPGLIDTHVHLLDSKNDLYLYIANGVTSVCEMFGTTKHLKWSKAAKNGAISPNLYVSTSKVASQKGLPSKIEKYFGGGLHYTSPKAARAAVQQFKQAGYDAVKLSSNLNLEIYQAIIEEAEKQDIPVIGHLSHKIGLENLYSSGQSELAHVEEITKSTMVDFNGYVSEKPEEYLEYLSARADSIAIKLKESEIAVSTTVWLMESLPRQRFELEQFLKTIEVEYVNPGILEGSNMVGGWLPGSNEYENPDSESDTEQARVYWNTYAEAVRIMTKALADHGVTLLVGTDANVTGVVPGFSLHDEMQSLSGMGLSNAEVLTAATLEPAEFMQIKTGTIRPGYKSDLVLLSKNPLEDIRYTQAIEHVFFGDHMMDKEQIQEILNAIKEINSLERNLDIKSHLQ